MQKKNKKIILITTAAILVLAGVFFGVYKFALTGDNYNPTYPSPTAQVFTERYGAINCRNVEGQWGAWGCEPMTGVDGKGVYQYITCPSTAGSQNCQMKLSASCSSFTGMGTAKPFVKRGSGSFEVLDTNKIYTLNSQTAGERFTIQCVYTSGSIFPPLPVYGTVIANQYCLQTPYRKLYVETYGWGNSGWLAGSEDCKLVSVDANTLRNMQKSSDNKLTGITQIAPGETKNIVVGWAADPTWGNLNPLGRYNNQDVFCKPFTGLYEAKKIDTVGVNDYWQTGSILKSYSGDNTLCCSNSNCASSVCENYQCTIKPVCTYGQCNPVQKGLIIKDDYTEEAGKFYHVVETCGNDLCISQSKSEVKCTRNYCDRMSTPQKKLWCDYEKGCVEVTVPQQCGNGYCCDGGNWVAQSCTGNMKCCKDLGDPYRGTCKNECVSEGCKDDKDCNEGEICKEGKCVRNYDKDKCEKEGNTWVTEKVCNFWCDIGLKDEVEKSYCKKETSYTLYIIIGILGVALIVFLIMLPKIMKASRRRR
jgi:hypothetical protein